MLWQTCVLAGAVARLRSVLFRGTQPYQSSRRDAYDQYLAILRIHTVTDPRSVTADPALTLVATTIVTVILNLTLCSDL